MSQITDQLVTLISAKPWLPPALGLLFGSMVGSFLNVVAHRLPPLVQWRWRAEASSILGIDFSAGAEPDNLVYPPSRCPHCRATIPAYYNLPIIGWLLIRGRCVVCHNKVSPRYPLVELGVALTTAFTLWRFGAESGAIAGITLTAFCWAIVLTFEQSGLILTQLTIPLLISGILLSAIGGASLGSNAAIIGAGAGSVFGWILVRTMPSGAKADVLLFAALGAFLGPGGVCWLVGLTGVGLAVLLVSAKLFRATWTVAPSIVGILIGWSLFQIRMP